jgi:hypothetical protein
MRRRLIVALVLVAIASVVACTMPAPAQAETLTTSQSTTVPAGFTPIAPARLAAKAAKAAAKAEADAAAATPTTGAHSDISLQVGWGTATLSLSHSDIGWIISQEWLKASVTGGLDVLCTYLEYPPIIIGCVAAVAILGSLVNQYLLDAWENVTYEAAWACDAAGAWSCPGAILSFWGWLYPIEDTGLNIEFLWTGNPVGWAYN